MMNKTLPHYLVVDILTRLPVKSLIRFKCVHRSWNDVFKTPSFINRHMLQQLERVVIFKDLDNQSYSLFGNKKCHVTLLDPSSQSSESYMIPSITQCPISVACIPRIRSYAPYKGIFCLHISCHHDHNELILWNPATREEKIVYIPNSPDASIPNSPDASIYNDTDDSPDASIYNDSVDASIYNNTVDDKIFRGFGGDPDTNDFNIVNVMITYGEHHLDSPVVQIYNLATDSWRVIDDNNTFPLAAFSTEGDRNRRRTIGIVANGVCHWLIDSGLKENDNIIVCFDFRNNRFHLLEHPPVKVTKRSIFSHLDAVNDCIAYVHLYPLLHEGFCANIWIFKHDSWNKYYKFEPLPLGFAFYALWKDGHEFIGESEPESEFDDFTGSMVPAPPHLVSYNFDYMKVSQFQDIKVNKKSTLKHPVWKYVESIAPLST